MAMGFPLGFTMFPPLKMATALVTYMHYEVRDYVSIREVKLTT